MNFFAKDLLIIQICTYGGEKVNSDYLLYTNYLQNKITSSLSLYTQNFHQILSINFKTYPANRLTDKQTN